MLAGSRDQGSVVEVNLLCVFQEASLLRSLQLLVMLPSYLTGNMADVNNFSRKHGSELNGSFQEVIIFVHGKCGWMVMNLDF